MLSGVCVYVCMYVCIFCVCVLSFFCCLFFWLFLVILCVSITHHCLVTSKHNIAHHIREKTKNVQTNTLSVRHQFSLASHSLQVVAMRWSVHQ
jgi:1,4-dihydroxy-2-naphthoate octaprenyltransferase